LLKNLFIRSLIILLVACVLSPAFSVKNSAEFSVENLSISVITPPSVTSGETFAVNIAVSEVSNLVGYQFDLTYNTAVIQIAGGEGGQAVSPGMIGSTSIPVDIWSYIPSGQQGTIRVLGHFADIQPVNGHGNLAQIYFIVVGIPGESSTVNITNAKLIDPETEYITPVTLISGLVSVFDLSISTSSLPEAIKGTYYSAELNALGGKNPYTWEGTNLPDGLEISQDGHISGIPAASGEYSTKVKVTDSFTPQHTANRTLALKVFSPLKINTTGIPSAWTTIAYSFTFNAADGKSPYAWSASGLPAGLTISTEGTISGVPQASGEYNINIIISDSFNPANSNSRTYKLKVNLYGDADGNGLVDMRDVLKVQRVILLLDPVTTAADINRDGKISMVDIIWIEIVILRQ
jgi:hypothetical protein